MISFASKSIFPPCLRDTKSIATFVYGIESPVLRISIMTKVSSSKNDTNALIFKRLAYIIVAFIYVLILIKNKQIINS